MTIPHPDRSPPSAAPPDVWDRVEAILSVGRPLSVGLTGGGSVAVGWLLNHPGASRSVVDARIPYHEAALAAELGDPGPHRVGAETARRLAWRAGRRAAAAGADALGLGATAALATGRERRGDDRADAVVRAPGAYYHLHLSFAKGGPGHVDGPGRVDQEDALSRALVDLLARGLGLDAGAGLRLPYWVAADTCRWPVEEGLEALLEGRVEAVEMRPGASAVPPEPRPDRLLVPGSFHPLHAGHEGLAAAAERRSGRRADLELSVANVDKPPLAYDEILRRAGQARGRRLLLTREPTFLGKARVFPGCWFAIGYDTAVRLVEPRYYQDGAAGRDAALAELRDLGCRFLVAGRQWQGAFRRLQDVDVPAGFADLLAEIPEAEFRQDISSTQLRQGE